MTELSAEMKRVVLEQRLGFAATVSPDGLPNLSPKGTTTIWDDHHLMFADIASPGTVENLTHNPAIEINVVDPFLRKGFRFRGEATLHRRGTLYGRGLVLLKSRDYQLEDRINTVVLVRVLEARPLTSPVYRPGVSEAEVSAHWRAHYDGLHAARKASEGIHGSVP